MSVQAQDSITSKIDIAKNDAKSRVKVSYDSKKSVYIFSNAKTENLLPKDIAQTLLDDITGLGTGENFYAHLKQIDEENVIDVLSEYKKLSEKSLGEGKGETLIDSIYAEYELSSSKQKIYANMIKDKLSNISDELKIDNTIINGKWNDELESVTKGFLPKIGIINTKNLNFFVDEYIKRIDIRKKLIADNETKFESGEIIKPLKSRVEYVNNIIKGHNISTDDTLGDGKINHHAKQTNGTCWAVGAIHAFCADEEINEHLNSCIYKKDGVISVYLPQADKVYSYTENEILEATYYAIGAIGDGDISAMLMAADSYLKEVKDPINQDIKTGHTLHRMMEMLAGYKADSSNVSLKMDDIEKGNLIYKEGMSYNSIDKLVESFNKNNITCAVVSFNPLAQSSTQAVKIKDGDSEENAVKTNTLNSHVYSIKDIDDKYVYMIDSNTPDSLVRVPHIFLWYTDAFAAYKYR